MKAVDIRLPVFPCIATTQATSSGDETICVGLAGVNIEQRMEYEVGSTGDCVSVLGGSGGYLKLTSKSSR
jgi:hypothetical protein